MATVRKVVDSSALANIFELPPDFKNKKIEIVLSSLDETEKVSASTKNNPPLTIAQIEEWVKAPEVQALVGALKGVLPADLSITDIRNERLAKKYKT